MKSFLFVVILAVVRNAVVGRHHPGYHHHKNEFDHHRPWDYHLDPWKDINDRNSKPESKESWEYDSNEWGDDDGNDDWWANNRPPMPVREPGIQECSRLCHLPNDYLPVCGTDNITYKNLDHLHCARQCGVAVSVRKLTKCHDHKSNGGWTKLPVATPSYNGNDWTRTPATNGNGFWPSTKTPSAHGNDFWTRRPSTNGFNFWTKTPKVTPSPNNIDFWTRLTPRTPSTVSGDFWTNRPPNTWTPSTNDNNGWTTPTPSNINSIESCIRSCAKSTSNSPICGTNNFIYNNLEHLHCAQLCGIDVTEQRLSQCPKGNNAGNGNPEATTSPIQGRTTMPPNFQACIRTCPSTSEYNPVCGTDGVTYNNLGQLWCAQQCGTNVALHRQSPCPATAATETATEAATQRPTGSTTQSPEVAACIRSCPVTSEFNPICGTDGITYSNNGRLECAKFCGVDVKVGRNSACPTTPVTFGLETTTISMIPSSNQALDQNKQPVETIPVNNNGTGFTTIPADILASVFTEARPTTAPDEDIDPRFNENGHNNNTNTSAIKYPQ